MGSIASRSRTTLQVHGRDFAVERIAWRNSDGLSFDIYDGPTGLLLTNESYDDCPTVEDVDSLIDDLAEDLRSGTLQSPEHGDIFMGEEATVREIVEAVERARAQAAEDRFAAPCGPGACTAHDGTGD